MAGTTHHTRLRSEVDDKVLLAAVQVNGMFYISQQPLFPSVNPLISTSPFRLLLMPHHQSLCVLPAASHVPPQMFKPGKALRDQVLGGRYNAVLKYDTNRHTYIPRFVCFVRVLSC